MGVLLVLLLLLLLFLILFFLLLLLLFNQASSASCPLSFSGSQRKRFPSFRATQVDHSLPRERCSCSMSAVHCSAFLVPRIIY